MTPIRTTHYALRNTVAVLLIAYGGPQSLDEVEPFLLEVRGGRATPPALTEEIKRRYAAIGGRSPLPEITARQATALEVCLGSGYDLPAKVYVGMRHGRPSIREAVARMAAHCMGHMVALSMSPYYSSITTGHAFSLMDAALDALGAPMAVTRIDSWYAHPALITALAESARAGLRHFGVPGLSRLPKVIFTAHSIPTRVRDQGDPYADQVRETAALVAGELDLAAEGWTFCYQSAGRSPEPWLGPSVEDVVSELAHAGERDLLVVPTGFTCDQVELLYDVDIACRALAQAHGARLERAPALNASPTLIGALAELVAGVNHGQNRHG
jgi:ferrochelatase